MRSERGPLEPEKDDLLAADKEAGNNWAERQRRTFEARNGPKQEALATENVKNTLRDLLK